MTDIDYRATEDELTKIALLGNIWQSFLDIFRGERAKFKRRVDYFFSPKAGKDKWEKLEKNVRSQEFVDQVKDHKLSDDKLKLHVQSMHELSRGKPAGKIESSRLPGKTYEIRKISGGLGCTCPDWRFKGTVNPGYECKHIKALKAGKKKSAMLGTILALGARGAYETEARPRIEKLLNKERTNRRVIRRSDF